MITIIQGESFPINIKIRKNGVTVKPADVTDLMICVSGISHRLSRSELKFKEESEKWEFFPTQEETMRMNAGYHDLWAHIKYTSGVVRKVKGEKILIEEGDCEVLL